MSVDEVQEGTRPSLFVRAVKAIGELGCGVRRVIVTGMLEAGRPVRVSRMWQVIGGRVAGAIFGGGCGCGCVEVRWEDIVVRRSVGVECGIYNQLGGSVGVVYAREQVVDKGRELILYAESGSVVV